MPDSTAAFSWASCPTADFDPRPPAELADAVQRVEARYRPLLELPVIEDAQGRRRFDRAMLYRREGLNILFLHGNHVEMAWQHGRILQAEIRQGAPPASSRVVHNALASSTGLSGWPVQWLADLLHRTATLPLLTHSLAELARCFPGESLHDEAAAMAAGSGLPLSLLAEALLSPEVLLYLAAWGSLAPRARVPLWETPVAPPQACSSFAAWGEATAGERLIVGRNLDYPLNGHFDRHPTVIYFDPVGGGQRYMSFTSAGAHTAGLSAYNEAGLFLASHTVPTWDVSLRGVAACMTASLIIRRAKTFDEAAQWFSRLLPPTGWAYLLVSTRERRIATVELSAGRCEVRESRGGLHAQTNHYLSPVMQERNLLLNASIAEDAEARRLRLHQRLESARGRLNVDEAISILGDQVDPFAGKVRGLGNTVGVHTTMSSLVLDPAENRAFVAGGPAPACHGTYVELPLAGSPAASGPAFAEYRGETRKSNSFREAHPEKLAALAKFIEAKAAYEYRQDSARALALLEQVVQVDSSNPAYWFQLGIFLLRCGEHRRALVALDRVLHGSYQTAQLWRLAHYYRGRAFAHLGERTAAEAELAPVIDDPSADEKLRSAAQSTLRSINLFGWRRLTLRSLAILMQQSDMLRY